MRRRRNPRSAIQVKSNAMHLYVDCGDAVLYIALAQTERFYATPENVTIRKDIITQLCLVKPTRKVYFYAYKQILKRAIHNAT